MVVKRVSLHPLRRQPFTPSHCLKYLFARPALEATLSIWESTRILPENSNAPKLDKDFQVCFSAVTERVLWFAVTWQPVSWKQRCSLVIGCLLFVSLNFRAPRYTDLRGDTRWLCWNRPMVSEDREIAGLRVKHGRINAKPCKLKSTRGSTSEALRSQEQIHRSRKTYQSESIVEYFYHRYDISDITVLRVQHLPKSISLGAKEISCKEIYSWQRGKYQQCPPVMRFT